MSYHTEPMLGQHCQQLCENYNIVKHLKVFSNIKISIKIQLGFDMKNVNLPKES